MITMSVPPDRIRRRVAPWLRLIKLLLTICLLALALWRGVVVLP